MPSLRIRRYRHLDADALVALWLASWHSAGVPARGVTIAELRDRWDEELAGGWQAHVAVAGRELLGFVAFQDGVLEQLFVAPGSQGQGIGGQLLALAKRAMPAGFSLTTAVESRAETFYEGAGLRRGAESRNPRLGHRSVRYDWRGEGAAPHACLPRRVAP